MNPITVQPIHQFSGSLKASHDTLAEEMPVALIYNGVSHLVLMATPHHLAELALGFSLSEGILTHTGQLYDLNIKHEPQGIAIELHIASERFMLLKEKRRNLNGRTGCGLCGIDSLQAAQPPIAVVKRQHKIPIAHIQAALTQLNQHQPLRAQTGSLHSAAWVQAGNIQAAFEDVGRHNALDKLLGWLAQHQLDTADGFIIISSRASYEMVSKAATLGIGALIAVSAATAMAQRVAQQSNLTLIGFAKPHQFTIYSHPQWLHDESCPIQAA